MSTKSHSVRLDDTLATHVSVGVEKSHPVGRIGTLGLIHVVDYAVPGAAEQAPPYQYGCRICMHVCDDYVEMCVHVVQRHMGESA